MSDYRNTSSRTLATARALLCAIFLGACASGGGGLAGVGINQIGSSGGVASSGGTTPEQQANFGLAAIDSFAAYIAGATEQGVKVAIIDTGTTSTISTSGRQAGISWMFIRSSSASFCLSKHQLAEEDRMNNLLRHHI